MHDVVCVAKQAVHAALVAMVTFSLHAHGQALHVAAVLTAVPLPLVDQATFLIAAGILQVFAHCAFEEALAALATVDGEKGRRNVHTHHRQT